MVSYGLAYGMESYGLASRLSIPVPEAQDILDAYFEAFPNVKAYMEQTVAAVLTQLNWTDDRVEQLKNLWTEGLSASQIARALGGVTRNAVIGKVHRLGLPGRGAPCRPTRPTRKARPRARGIASRSGSASSGRSPERRKADRTAARYSSTTRPR